MIRGCAALLNIWVAERSHRGTGDMAPDYSFAELQPSELRGVINRTS